MADIVITQLGPLWTLADVKEHLRVEGDDEDGLIAAYMDAAERALLRFCNLTLVPYQQEAVFKAAGFITVSAFYDNRLMNEGEDGIPAAARALVWPYRWLPI
ncbi:head-tail connector protein [Pelagibacterium mangrovi]|uniref:head-tail connector protein n=1 Tax=Pelagibacterium mangrovi TaxID=3119828 RepID=UPI002FCB6751